MEETRTVLAALERLILAGDLDQELRFQLANMADLCTPDVRAKLVKDPDVDVRCALAKTLNLEVAIQAELVRDASHVVRSYMAINPSLDYSLHREVAQDLDQLVRYDFARRVKADSPAQDLIAVDLDRSVRAALASNPDVRLDIQPKLSFDLDLDVARSLAANPHVVVTGDFEAAFVRSFQPALYARATRCIDPEVLNGLMENWSGSMDGLVESCRLVVR